MRVRLPTRCASIPHRLPQTLIHDRRRQADPAGSGRAPGARQRPVGAAAREPPAAWRSSAAISKAATWAAPSTKSARELQKLKLPVGYSYEIGGQYESQQQSFRELLMVFGIAVVLVFIILVIQFRAWLPAIADPARRAAVARRRTRCSCWLTGTDLNVSSAMGLILLIGLVVKNGIMLLDFSERLHEQGEPFEAAIAHAGRIRLRPILMTTFCTLFGLLPLALGLGAGAELQRPLALAVIGGLTLSTPVTLLSCPGSTGLSR